MLTAAGVIGTALALSGSPMRDINVHVPTKSTEELAPAETARTKKHRHGVNALRLVTLGVGIVAIKSTRPRR